MIGLVSGYGLNPNVWSLFVLGDRQIQPNMMQYIPVSDVISVSVDITFCQQLESVGDGKEINSGN